MVVRIAAEERQRAQLNVVSGRAIGWGMSLVFRPICKVASGSWEGIAYRGGGEGGEEHLVLGELK